MSIFGGGDYITLLINNADTAGVQSFNGYGVKDQLVTAGSTLDLSHTKVSGFTVASSNALGTTFTVSDLGTAFQIAGGSGHDTLIAQGFTLTAAQRTEIFATNSIETIVDQSGTFAVACYCRATLILTDNGEVPVENLKIGDFLMTMSGQLRPIKWIGRRSYGGRFLVGQNHILPICIKAGALDENTPKRDLWISPQHAMYLGGILIEASNLVNGVSVVQAERVDKVEYFHVELDSHDVIIAEGAYSESFVDDDSRGMFHNAREYGALYPDAAVVAARYCASRRQDGYEVEAVRQCIALRAGLRSADAQTTGVLLGYVDRVDAKCIAGWAQNADHREAPVCLDIYAGGQLIGQTLANRYREDLEQAKLGSGRHGFVFTPPAGLDVVGNVVEVRRSLDGATLQLVASRRGLQRIAVA